jgi:hypothetical protein
MKDVNVALIGVEGMKGESLRKLFLEEKCFQRRQPGTERGCATRWPVLSFSWRVLPVGIHDRA